MRIFLQRNLDFAYLDYLSSTTPLIHLAHFIHTYGLHYAGQTMFSTGQNMMISWYLYTQRQW